MEIKMKTVSNAAAAPALAGLFYPASIAIDMTGTVRYM
jgi:hypothetical protein